MAIEWYSPQGPAPSATLTPSGISLNSTAVKCFNGPKKVKLGLDAEKKIVVIKPADESGQGAIHFPKVNDKMKTAKISCADFIKFLSLRLGADKVSIPGRYAGTWEKNALEINLDQKMFSRSRKATNG